YLVSKKTNAFNELHRIVWKTKKGTFFLFKQILKYQPVARAQTCTGSTTSFEFRLRCHKQKWKDRHRLLCSQYFLNCDMDLTVSELNFFFIKRLNIHFIGKLNALWHSNVSGTKNKVFFVSFDFSIQHKNHRKDKRF